ncbi:Ada metal-binding domain-containing protein [Neomoorella thermoacetica]
MQELSREKRILLYNNREGAIRAGYRPCKVCWL